MERFFGKLQNGMISLLERTLCWKESGMFKRVYLKAVLTEIEETDRQIKHHYHFKVCWDNSRKVNLKVKLGKIGERFVLSSKYIRLY